MTEAPLFPHRDRGADISESANGLYRYHLWRQWEAGPSMTFIMLNPSTADADVDDPTIRRCMGFARREGFGGIEVINLYALRATRPVHLLDHPHPEGPRNREVWDLVLQHDGPVVAAWGSSAPDGCPTSEALNDHPSEMLDWLCLGRTSKGNPRHPLYQRKDEPLTSFGEIR